MAVFYLPHADSELLPAWANSQLRTTPVCLLASYAQPGEFPLGVLTDFPGLGGWLLQWPEQ